VLGLCEDNCSDAPTECPKGMAYYGNLVWLVSCACCAARPPVLCDALCLWVYCFVFTVVLVDGRETLANNSRARPAHCRLVVALHIVKALTMCTFWGGLQQCIIKLSTHSLRITLWHPGNSQHGLGASPTERYAFCMTACVNAFEAHLSVPFLAHQGSFDLCISHTCV
jgi:hypothetical protein